QIGAGQNPFVEPNERGLSNLDQTHNFTMNWVYELPRLGWSSGVVRAVLGGWEWSGNATFNSGFPFLVTQSGDRAGVGGGTQRPDVVGTRAITGSVSQYFNTAAFALAPLGRFGNEGINVVRGPGISDDITMNFYKNFALHLFGAENQNLRIGAEF